jgi:Transposase
VSFNANGGTLVSVHSTDPALARVQVGIDAAVVADHHVTIRSTLSDGQVQLSRFHVPPTIAGLSRLGERLCSFPGVVAVAEPTSMTWLGLHVALQRAGCDLSLVGTRHAARLRGAISGKHKSDVIDADVLSLASDVFELSPLDPPQAAQLALRRAVVRRGKLVIDGNRARRRLISLARWAFPDVWTAFAGSWPTAIAVLPRWPDLRALASARTLQRHRGRGRAHPRRVWCRRACRRDPGGCCGMGRVLGRTSGLGRAGVGDH